MFEQFIGIAVEKITDPGIMKSIFQGTVQFYGGKLLAQDGLVIIFF